MHLARFPRLHFAHLPTPLEFLPNLTRELGGPEIYIKRDDCTGLATGGNKTRKLEFLMGEAVKQGAEIIVTQGAVQTNHGRQSAAAAKRFGLECEILLEKRVSNPSQIYMTQGNILLDHLLQARLSYHEAGTDMNALAQKRVDELQGQGKKAYFIPGGGSNRIGALGYVNCALELLQQINDQSLKVDWIVHATGSAGTQAGLIAGVEGANIGIPVYGISVKASKDIQEQNVYQLAEDIAQMLGIKGGISRDKVTANSDYVGEGYGIPSQSTIEAIKMLARLEGIFLDPVYSGKGMAGLIDLIRKGFFKKDERIVFIHTGGQAGLFAYADQFSL